jgi:branched-subunit amino acid ABC-type transport system permease component
MRDLLPFIVSGLAAGSIYGIAGMGLVLTFRTSGVFNFAHGAVAAVGAYAFWDLHYRHGWLWPPAAVLVVVAGGVVAGLLLERLGRALAEVAPAMRVVATVGLLLLIQGLLAAVYGSTARQSPAFLPTDTVRIAGVGIGLDQILVAVTAGVIAAGLSFLLGRTRSGMAMRAVVDNPTLLAYHGTGPDRIRRLAWMIGSAVAIGSGILIAPSIGLDPFLLTLLVVQAFGAAAIGRFSSLPLTYAGGLVVGIGGALAQRYLNGSDVLRGFPASFPFVVLFAVLLLARPGRFFAERPVRNRVPMRGGPLPPVLRWTGYAVVAGLLLIAPRLAGNRLPVYVAGMAMVVVFLSLGLLVQHSKQVSLCHAAFAAVGAVALSHLAGGAGLPWPVALVGAGLCAVPVGAVVAVPAIRLSGVYLALATFGFGILMQRVAYPTGLMFGGGGFRTVPRPHFAGINPQSDTAYYYVVLAVAVAAGAMVVALQRSRLGLLLRALADSPTALATSGTSTNLLRVFVFCLSAFLAGVGGALLGSGTTAVQAVAGFGPFESLIWLTVLVIAGRSPIRAALVAAFLLSVAPAYAGAALAEHQTIYFGVVALTAASFSGRIDFQAALRSATGRTAFRVASPGRMSERMAGRLADPASPGPIRARTEEALARG